MYAKLKTLDVAAAGVRNNTNKFIQPFDDNTKIKPSDCPKYSHCFANICPLDSDMLCRLHLKGEAVCFYLHEYVKKGGKARLGGYISEKHLEAIEKCYPKIINRFGDIKRRLKRSVKSGCKIGKRPGKRIKAAA